MEEEVFIFNVDLYYVFHYFLLKNDLRGSIIRYYYSAVSIPLKTVNLLLLNFL